MLYVREMKNILFAYLFFLLPPLLSEGQNLIETDTLRWENPGNTSNNAIPLGNGDIGISAWAEDKGDVVFYISKTDAWSENARLLKLGKVRLQITPNPFHSINDFQQILNIRTGTLSIKGNETDVDIWVDANNSVVKIEIKSEKAFTAKVNLEPWRTERRKITDKNELHSAYGIWAEGQPDVWVEKDSILNSGRNDLVWVHRNERSIWKDNLKLQGLEEWANNSSDPLLNNTFGGLVNSPQMKKIDPSELQTIRAGKNLNLSVYALTKQTGSIEEWINELDKIITASNKTSYEERKENHIKWWEEFWERSYIRITSNDTLENKKVAIINRGYRLQRYMQACSGRGNSPIKFNGSIFSLDTEHHNNEYKGFDADYRRWGGPYWWQNTRLPYWAMPAAGDFDLMKPLFKMYLDALPLRKEATRKYYGHAGAFYPETMYFWGSYVGSNYGFDREGKTEGVTDNRYIRRYWQGGLEVTLLMLDYYDYTRDQDFANEKMIPFAIEIITFFNEHWPRNDMGKIRFEPAQSLETWWDAVNPLPEIVGIETVATKLLNLEESYLNPEHREMLNNILEDLPAIPVRYVEGEKVLAPADSFASKSNAENPELYAVFPYRRFTVGKQNIEMAKRTFNSREHKVTGGWQQSAIQAAYLGITDEAAKFVYENFSNWNKHYAFPAMWGPNYDWTPDQTHGSVAMTALQKMLLQVEGDDIRLMPAWPQNWNAIFKLHAPGNTILEGRIQNGMVEKLKVNPAERKKDVIIHFPE